ncbi:hypothetical protein [Paludibaculum fermentans]|uniref:hypothetical protein n=1 Tax=Paludibaculum fermentans TaxID=1473598 RepID=UPI003EC11FE5
MPQASHNWIRRLILEGPAEPGPWTARSTLGLVLLITAALSLWEATVKPFWFDEILTLQVSRLPTPESRWQALYEGCDGMPPGYYRINAIIAALPLEDHIRWRAPELLGWLLALVGVYLFVCPVNGRAAGVAAALLLSLTPVSAYAWEARPYALLVGVLALAAACWQRIARHWLWTLALALLLILATNLHYLAPLSVLCFALAEAALSLANRRWRWSVWAAFTAAAIPTFFALPLLLRMKQDFAAHFWARPEIGGLPYYYGNLLGFPLALSLVFLAFGFLYLLRSILHQPPASARWQAQVLALSLLCLPIISLVFTLATNGGFNERYTMPVVIGYAAAIPLLLEWKPGGMPRAFTLSLLVAFLVLSGRQALSLRTESAAVLDGESSPALQALRSSPAELLIVTNPLEFLPAWYYAKPAERTRLTFVGDLEAANRLGTTDGAVRLLLALAKFHPVPVSTLDQFLPGRRDFLLFTRGPAHLNWQVLRLKELRWRLQPLDAVAGGQLYRAFAPPPGS